eukprot:SAG11_NODE_8986_length_956_cov_1.053676_2_plen_87_part_01
MPKMMCSKQRVRRCPKSSNRHPDILASVIDALPQPTRDIDTLRARFIENMLAYLKYDYNLRRSLAVPVPAKTTRYRTLLLDTTTSER